MEHFIDLSGLRGPPVILNFGHRHPFYLKSSRVSMQEDELFSGYIIYFFLAIHLHINPFSAITLGHAVGLVIEGTSSYSKPRPPFEVLWTIVKDPTLTLAPSVGTMEEIPVHEGTAESNPLPTLEKEVDQRNNTIHQLETALRELLERQTREAALASEAVKRAEELARKARKRQT
ncbi:hypothetical protein PIB30_072504 [Stylosanthes scabra]|uniref:Uncharacterized protein n=1 Tax=Stylosanthes scabra TaxID=79078 RepID=A0ABU6ZMR7_9FABA|nr:hypothetical protein [Stylosanthes scabra]